MRIVINPGHGALIDRGAKGPTGLKEADVVRAVAQSMKRFGIYEFKRQNAFGLKSLLRTLRANPPAVVISLHCNSGSRDRHRMEAYYWAEDPAPMRCRDSAALAMRLVQNASEYAETAEVRIAPYMKRTLTGVKLFLPGILVETATTAAVIAELGYISDPHVEERMRTGEWVQAAANGVHQGIQRWLGKGD